MTENSDLEIVTCYGCENTFPKSAARMIDEPACPRCGTRVSTSLDRGDGSGIAPMICKVHTGTEQTDK